MNKTEQNKAAKRRERERYRKLGYKHFTVVGTLEEIEPVKDLWNIIKEKRKDKNI